MVRGELIALDRREKRLEDAKYCKGIVRLCGMYLPLDMQLMRAVKGLLKMAPNCEWRVDQDNATDMEEDPIESAV